MWRHTAIYGDIWRRIARALRRKSWVVVIFPNGSFAVTRGERDGDKRVSALTSAGSVVPCSLVTDQGSLRVYRLERGDVVQPGGRLLPNDQAPN